MKTIISKCGNLCSICPWGQWIRADMSHAEWESYARDAKKYVGFTPTKNACQCCQTPDEKLAKDVGIHNFIRGCSARKCALHSHLENCAFCSRYPCAKIVEMNRVDRVEETEKRLGESIPDDKYQAYLRPFEGRKTLDQIRKGLRSDQIREVETIDFMPPKTLSFPEVKMNEKNARYKTLHNVLTRIIVSSLDISDNDTIASQELLNARREVLLRLLWIMARYGSLKDSEVSVDSITLNEHKTGTSGFPTTDAAWRRWLEILSRMDIHARMEFSTQEKDKLMTPTGWLRECIPGSNEPVWYLRISFDEALGGVSSLGTLQSYARILDERKNKGAFTAFKKADMGFLHDT